MEHNYLIHSKGPWKNHKYLRKEGDKYYYNPTTEAFEKNLKAVEENTYKNKKRYIDAATGVKVTKESVDKQKILSNNQAFRNSDKKDLHKNDVNTEQSKKMVDAAKAFRVTDETAEQTKHTREVVDANKAFREANTVKMVKKESFASIASTKLGNISQKVAAKGKTFLDRIFHSQVKYTDAQGNKIVTSTKKKKGK